MKREEGYYWIKLHPEEDWQVAQYTAEAWWLIHDDTYYEDDEVVEVGEKICK